MVVVGGDEDREWEREEVGGDAGDGGKVGYSRKMAVWR